MKRILILHTSVGLGHKSMAQNIGWHLSQAGFEVKLEDIGKVQAGAFASVTLVIHQFINKHLSFVWGWIYRWGYLAGMPFRLIIASFNHQQALNLINDFNPDVVIGVQTAASGVIAYLKAKKLYTKPFGIGFSDYHIHPFWIYKQADFYLTNIEEQKQELIKRGVSGSKIFVIGMALKPKVQVDPIVIKQKLGINPEEKVVLIGTGSLGIGFNNEDLFKLAKLEHTKIIFACGKNKKLFEAINSLGLKNVIALPFYSPMDELYSVADIFVGKPGGLSTAEALQWRLPLLVTFTLPGQEEDNVDYLVKRQLIMLPDTDLFNTVKQELSSGKFRNQLKVNKFINPITDRGSAVVTAVSKGGLV